MYHSYRVNPPTHMAALMNAWGHAPSVCVRSLLLASHIPHTLTSQTRTVRIKHKHNNNNNNK